MSVMPSPYLPLKETTDMSDPEATLPVKGMVGNYESYRFRCGTFKLITDGFSGEVGSSCFSLLWSSPKLHVANRKTAVL